MWSWLRSCANCSCCLSPVDLYCEGCWNQLWRDVSFQRRDIAGGPFPIYSLWTWPGGSPIVEKFVRAQKGQSLLEARTKVAQRYLLQLPSPRPQGLFYVIPKNKKSDHGAEWAQAFSQVMGVPSYSLILPNKGNYKTKNRKQRWTERVVLNSYPSDLLEHYWFIDDVLTTGATAQAAWQSLGRPLSFRVVVMVYKEFQSK